MKIVNKCIVDGEKLNLEKYLNAVQNSSVAVIHKTYLLKLSDRCSSLRALNKKIYDYNYDLEQATKHTKRMDKFNYSEESDEVLKEDFDKFHDYVYSLISLKNYKSRVAKSGAKVQLYNIHNIYGKDEDETLKDVLQEGRLYLWEGLKKYGRHPEKAKNFKGRLDKGFERIKSSKSTFVFQNMKNNYINLGSRSSSDKFKHFPVEFSQRTMGEKDDDI